MTAAALPFEMTIALEVLEDAYVDPVALFDAVRMATANLPHFVIRGVDEFAGQVPESAQIPEAALYRTVEQLREFVDGLAQQVRCSAFFDDRVVHYSIEFQFDATEPLNGLGQTSKSTLLLRDGEPVLRSTSEVDYAGSDDASSDYSVGRRESTELLASDELAQATFELLRTDRRLPPR